MNITKYFLNFSTGSEPPSNKGTTETLTNGEEAKTKFNKTPEY
ncbi:unnamed protein product [Gulo gulo]|uniref:Uncharacterized protein n=1 Tax=Gulo gulo TaxID=48420 RepID=A0A9X9LM99_GULGU|nr:unnamed protein product [Gulo gulo]